MTDVILHNGRISTLDPLGLAMRKPVQQQR